MCHNSYISLVVSYLSDYHDESTAKFSYFENIPSTIHIKKLDLAKERYPTTGSPAVYNYYQHVNAVSGYEKYSIEVGFPYSQKKLET